MAADVLITADQPTDALTLRLHPRRGETYRSAVMWGTSESYNVERDGAPDDPNRLQHECWLVGEAFVINVSFNDLGDWQTAVSTIKPSATSGAGWAIDRRVRTTRGRDLDRALDYCEARIERMRGAS